ncbi:hypothetical protein [Bhargavaea cecembensis]|uniref:hypothetical protein n=1 Tax=Bhargavaea cecembensis TaxID=394098 RepID=UPI00058E4E9F|nr:hypothetical protein [Bhargavaea cecembensis]
MDTIESIDEFVNAAMGMDPEEEPGNLFVSQDSEYQELADETVIEDEDTVRGNVMQVFAVLLETERGSLYFEYPFVEPFEMEEIQEKLEPLFERFPKVVLPHEEMAKKTGKAG